MKNCLCFFLLFFFCSAIAFSQQTKVNGVVISGEDNEPVIGASVTVKGKPTIGTVTDLDGKFVLDVPAGTKTLVVSYVGMKTQDVAAKANQKIVLESDAQQLGEVVVTGMVKMDKRLFTGASDKLSAADVKLDGMADVSRGLEGRSAGVSVQNVSGTFGTAPKIRVRGATSIMGNSKPLWVVDGVIMDDVTEVSADQLSSGDAVTLISSAISGLNSDDIESFQILKDGSATSIYGARAMSGVIVITTKKGKAGSSHLSYTGEFTTRMKPSYNNYNIMNSQDQMSVYQELENKGWLNFAETFRAQSSGVYGKMYKLINTYDPATGFGLANTIEARNAYLQSAEMRNTDWFDMLFSNSVMMNHSVSVSTGTEKSTSYVSLSVMTDPGWSKQSKVQRYTANLNNTYNILKNLSLNVIGSAAYRKQSAPGTVEQNTDAVTGQVKRDFDINPYSYALNTSRTLDPDAYYTRNYAPFNINNELENNNISLDVVDLKFQGEMKWKIIPGLEASVLGAAKFSITSQENKIKDNSNQAMAYRAMDDATIRDANSWLYKNPDIPNSLPFSILPKGGFYNKTEYKMFSYDFRAALSWNTVFKDIHIVNAYGGMEANSQDRIYNFFQGWGMQYDQGEIPFYDYLAFKKMREGNSNYYELENTKRRNVAFFATATYSYKGKYTLTGTGRYEGTNRLGKSRSARWLPTWNVAGAWNMHEENFFKHLEPALSHFTLKASYSLTADAGPASVSNSRVVINSYTPWRPFSNVSESGLQIMDLENSELTYEKKHELNIGADMGFLNNRINFTLDWYKRNNYDLIGVVNTMGIGGFTSKYANVATMKSHGVEMSLSTRNIQNKDFQWTTDFIFSINKNKVTNLDTKMAVMDFISGAGFAMEGYPVRGLFSIPFLGLDADGFPMYETERGIITKDNYGDLDFQNRDDINYLKYEGPTDPTITGSFGNIFSYKNFRLNIFITYSAGNKVRLDPVFKNKYNDLDATPKEFKNRWMVPGDENFTSVPVIASARQNKQYQNLEMGYNAYNFTSERIADGGFIRMKEISLSYDFPKSIIKTPLISNLSLKVQATNLFLIYADKKLNGQDPEFITSGGVATPNPRQFTFTVRLSL